MRDNSLDYIECREGTGVHSYEEILYQRACQGSVLITKFLLLFDSRKLDSTLTAISKRTSCHCQSEVSFQRHSDPISFSFCGLVTQHLLPLHVSDCMCHSTSCSVDENLLPRCNWPRFDLVRFSIRTAGHSKLEERLVMWANLTQLSA